MKTNETEIGFLILSIKSLVFIVKCDRIIKTSTRKLRAFIIHHIVYWLKYDSDERNDMCTCLKKTKQNIDQTKMRLRSMFE